MGGGCGMRIPDAERASPVPHVVASNILRGDYAGSDRCKDCHASQFRIGSPNETVRVEQDRPLECSLCHAEKSSEEVLSTMETWWGKHYDRQALRVLYGDLAQSPLMATLARGKPHEQAVAIISMREQNTVSALPHIARLIAHPIPLVRYQARKTIDAFISKKCGIDLDGKVGDIVAATLRCVPQAYPIPVGVAAEEGPPALHDNE